MNDCMVHDIVCCSPAERPEIVDPCNECGLNTQCKRQSNGKVRCECLPHYFGDPRVECQPECVVSSDCSKNMACVQQKCSDPCIGTCGIKAECQVVNHEAVCFCPQEYTGSPFVSCKRIIESEF